MRTILPGPSDAVSGRKHRPSGQPPAHGQFPRAAPWCLPRISKKHPSS